MAFIKFKPIASQFNFFVKIPRNQLDRESLSYVDNEEEILLAFRSKRDVGIFTDKRIILIDKKGFRGFRKSIYSIKYESISSYALNIHSLDSTIEIITDSSHRLLINFLKPISLDDVHIIYRYITNCFIEE
ncbi:MAG: PH domain-containing protein [Bacilli bacterium]|nr:PH domain-containing protein [Bacilli bacterium]MDD3304764.1 PH domain-containing protein [Bacilli bacterium]MDD4411640.1 PH domain-containing protein [Bacilli bacterium]